MKKLLLFIPILYIISCAPTKITRPEFKETNPQYFYDYTLDLTDTISYQFRVDLKIDSLKLDNNIFNFASVIPGSYTIEDFGRLVKEFKVFDSEGKEINSLRISNNRFKFDTPEKVRKICYYVNQTWKFKFDSNKVSEMSGTCLDKEHALINTFATFGYVNNLKNKPFKISLKYPQGWTVGTQLYKNIGNSYFTGNFRELTESPILLGKLTHDEFEVQGIGIDVYSYSKSNIISADDISSTLKKIIKAEVKFMDRIPTDRYTFLFNFADKTVGAHEHPNCSVYIIRDDKFNNIKKIIEEVSAHEFYHLQMPLMFGESFLKDYDFENPHPTKYLWFYEGAVEWASKMILYKSGIFNEEDFFDDYISKLNRMQTYKSMSIEDLSINSYLLPDQYSNVYSKGDIITKLLDILILTESKGTKSFRDVTNALAKKHGYNNPLESKEFYKEIAELSYPKVKTFIDNCITNNDNLPIAEYMDLIGIRYFPCYKPPTIKSTVGFSIWQDSDNFKFIIKNPDPRTAQMGIKNNDTLIAINDVPVNDNNLESLLSSLDIGSTKTDVSYAVTVKRKSEKLTFKLKTIDQLYYNILMPSPSLQSDNEKSFYFNKWKSF